MTSIVVAFPKRETASNIKKILAQSGYDVHAVCVTGAQVLSGIEELDGGIIICGARFVDMMYTEICECLPENFSVLLIAGADVVRDREGGSLVCLTLPLKVHELLHTVEMMEQEMRRERKRRRRIPQERTEEERRTLSRAKELLMERNGMTEDEAHRYIQTRSMENGTGLIEVAQMILSLMGDA
ncbi:MAG: ANTAR domain-containing protein [Clostridiales bacterium]|nr:ANTAR domain-containing protein [Clostridiales bacterium]